MTGVPPFASAKAYATPVLLGWRKQLLGAKWLGAQGRAQRAQIETELARRQALTPTQPDNDN